jgi:hypothetical protein
MAPRMLTVASAVIIGLAILFSYLRHNHVVPAMTFETLPPLFLYTPLILIVDFLETVLRSVTPPNLYLFRQVMGYMHTSQLYAIADLRIADHLIAGPLHSLKLAPLITSCSSSTEPESSCEAVSLRITRLLRATAAYGIFREQGDSAVFEHTAASQFLCADHKFTLRSATLNFGGVQFGQMESLPESIRTGVSSFSLRYGDEIWHWFEAHPESHKVGHQ